MSTLNLIATHHGLAKLDVLNRIKPDYESGWFRSLPSNSAMADMVSVELPTATPDFYLITDQAVETLQAKIAASAKRSPGASKLLRLRQRAQALDVCTEALDCLLQEEAERLIDRALTLSARHGARARVRLSTLSQLSNAGFIDPADLDAVKVAMMPSQMVSDLVSNVNSHENDRWQTYRMSAVKDLKLTVARTPGRARRGVKTAVSCRKKVGMLKPIKPLTKAAYLELGTKAASDKAYNKAQRQANAKLARKARRGNGKAKHSVGESPMCIKPLFDLCAAGHVGVKASK